MRIDKAPTPMSEREPSVEEMAAWLETEAGVAEAYLRQGMSPMSRFTDADTAMLRAIAARLRAPSAGKSEPPPTWQGEDA